MKDPGVMDGLGWVIVLDLQDRVNLYFSQKLVTNSEFKFSYYCRAFLSLPKVGQKYLRLFMIVNNRNLIKSTQLKIPSQFRKGFCGNQKLRNKENEF